MSEPPDPTADIPDLIGMVDMPAEMERIRSATYTGRDQDNVVTAVVDGDGTVVRISFGSTTSSRTPDVVENAIVAAVAAAQDRMDDAWRQLANRLGPAPMESTESGAAHGGIELAYDPSAEDPS